MVNGMREREKDRGPCNWASSSKQKVIVFTTCELCCSGRGGGGREAKTIRPRCPLLNPLEMSLTQVEHHEPSTTFDLFQRLRKEIVHRVASRKEGSSQGEEGNGQGFTTA